ncbi:MAG: hypothetical protein IKQ43_04390 [Treponema sp.]|nr:hypothetical protein [Treponema sp.]
MKLNRIIVIAVMTVTVLLSSCNKNNSTESESLSESTQAVDETTDSSKNVNALSFDNNHESATDNQISVEEKTEPEKSKYQIIVERIKSIGYQTEDPLKTNYTGPYDGWYTWHTRENNYDINDKRLSKEKLLSTLWLLDDKLYYSYRLLFYSDDYFKIGSHWDGPDAFGRYKVEDGKVILYDYDHVQRDIYDRIFTSEEVIGELKFESDSFLVDNELLFNGVRFIPNGCPKLDGSHALIDGINAIAVNLKVVLTDNVKFRTAPNTKAETMVSEIYEEIFHNEPNWRMPDCLIKGEVLTLYARTENPETIDGATAYWYYTGMPMVTGYYQYGWIFGGWFEDYDEAKKDEYFEMRRKYFQ